MILSMVNKDKCTLLNRTGADQVYENKQTSKIIRFVEYSRTVKVYKDGVSTTAFEYGLLNSNQSPFLCIGHNVLSIICTMLLDRKGCTVICVFELLNVYWVCTYIEQHSLKEQCVPFCLVEDIKVKGILRHGSFVHFIFCRGSKRT